MCSMFVVVANGSQQVGDVVIVQPIPNVSPFALGDDKSQLAENAQLVGNRTRLHLDRGRELIDGQRLRQERIQDADPAGGSEDTH